MLSQCCLSFSGTHVYRRDFTKAFEGNTRNHESGSEFFQSQFLFLLWSVVIICSSTCILYHYWRGLIASSHLLCWNNDQLAITIGITLSYIFGIYLNWRSLALLGIPCYYFLFLLESKMGAWGEVQVTITWTSCKGQECKVGNLWEI